MIKEFAENIKNLRIKKGLTQSQLAQSQAIYNFVNAKTQLEQILGIDSVE